MATVHSALVDRSVVVVFDNCEHLLPGIAELIAALLAASAGVRVLATSREALGIPGERVCPVDPLHVPAESPPSRRSRSPTPARCSSPACR